ncbi:MAG: hypothetical protein IJO93_03080, partial [Clostridia bacterium]|nr:hypothetical protein [Clostridia bacterium]
MANKKDTSSKKKTQNKSPKKAAQDNNLPTQVRSEISGIIWITAGLLLALPIYVIAESPFGKVISSFVFGLTGIAGYLLPVV